MNLKKFGFILVLSLCLLLTGCGKYTSGDAQKDLEKKIENLKSYKLTGEMEIRPINEIASSHLARRTFVGNAYKQVADPNVVGKMSGHVEGSRAFRLYRSIDDDMKRKLVEMID